MTKTTTLDYDRMYQRFKRWIAKHPAHEIAGVPGSANACPLAQYLNETTHATRIRVRSHTVDYLQLSHSTGTKVRQNKMLPNWARYFIDRFDEQNRFGDESYSSTSYQHCLDILATYELDIAPYAHRSLVDV